MPESGEGLSPLEVMDAEADNLEQRAIGRARFLQTRGEIKTPGLLIELVDEILRLRAIANEPTA